jgi:hypothetical protein
MINFIQYSSTYKKSMQIIGFFINKMIENIFYFRYNRRWFKKRSSFCTWIVKHRVLFLLRFDMLLNNSFHLLQTLPDNALQKCECWCIEAARNCSSKNTMD